LPILPLQRLYQCLVFSGDTLPCTKEGLCVAIADKVDSIVGIYGIGHKPTGSKDPYALKRAALGLLRMMIESKSQLDLFGLIKQSRCRLKTLDGNAH
jgi:glycyl-tRNA synthetase beta chain